MSTNIFQFSVNRLNEEKLRFSDPFFWNNQYQLCSQKYQEQEHAKKQQFLSFLLSNLTSCEEDNKLRNEKKKEKLINNKNETSVNYFFKEKSINKIYTELVGFCFNAKLNQIDFP